ncbi:MAG: hypothetical protein CVU69_02320 [Deltaproteobacteria bacterium HGW-Deltaproteobacteria-4]|nr:MAG: hypothetical protein CVU69_02320 [Deltaproteobacteria bacterium HGW-Deltaproteobacteria-4]
MKKQVSKVFWRLGLFTALTTLGGGLAFAADTVEDPILAAKTAQVYSQMEQRVTDEERAQAAAALKALRIQVYEAKKAVAKSKDGAPAKGIEVLDFKAIPTGPFDANGKPSVPDYYTTANWANSPPLAKFVDTLPGLGPDNANNLGKYLPVAVPDTVTYPGSDYYEIDLVEYNQQMHSDLPKSGTKLRGYVQANVNGGSNTACGNETGVECNDPMPVLYLGPVIVSERDRPVRIKFTNRLPNTGAGGDLFIPVDTSVMGAGTGPAYMGVSRGLGEPCNNDVEPNGCATYPQNRGNIHMHGGRTPWISDGTPHQWITPADENTPFVKGVSLQNVPDMPDPGDGASTYYFTNQQSARLMFYHDHSFGITRLNVYVGGAAGYLITDEYEQELINDGLIPEDQIPLVLQDKTFVDASEIRKYDPLWNWGSGAVDPVTKVREPVEGDLWLPHVYMPAQTSIAGFGGVNPFGRWMYGPWFYPATAVEKGPVANPYYDPDCSSTVPYILADCQTPGQPEQIPGTPNTSMGMEAFQDSVVVNGTAFPTLTVDPRAYRFRILNAASDRFWNLSFYEADSDPNNISPDPRLDPTSPSYLPGRSNRTEVKILPASIDLAKQNNWPENWPVDGRDGGVPDPATKGPSFLQIGTEGGFLPKPTIREAQPVTWMSDPTAFWVGVVDKTGLALGPAERADVIVDFSAYAGKTLILYNDAPAAWPARVASYDYFTGAEDLRSGGGYGAGGVYNPITGEWEGGHGILPGYAPNTRTVMQIVVTGGTSGLEAVDEPYEFDPVALHEVFVPTDPETESLFSRAQEPIIVGQAAYQDVYPDSYFPTNFPWEGVSQINDQMLNFVTVNNTVDNPQHVVAIQEPKGIHDEMGASFDPIYGRMSGNLAMQLPNPTTLNALLILYGFSDIPTEVIENSTELDVSIVPGTTTLADGTQIWKISHNGVDTHPIHFHIFDVQLINRVGWDGQIALPEENELGWKDTIKVSPLMDTIVAVRPRAPALPFGITNSLRPLNPAIPIDSPMGFNSVDWQTGEARNEAVTNVLYNFGWEYVWHCHILSHEEMDMMRPIVLNVATAKVSDFSSPAPGTAPQGVDVTWMDPTPVDYENNSGFGNPDNEIGFKIWRSAGATGPYTKVGAALANQTTYNDKDGSIADDYVIEAFNASGSTFSWVSPVSLTVDGGFIAPATFTLTATVTQPLLQSVTKVEFFNGDTLIGTDLDAPYTVTLTGMQQGSFDLKARATTDTPTEKGLEAFDTLTVDVNTSGLAADFTVNNGVEIGVCDTSTLYDASTGGTATAWEWLVNGVTYTTQNPDLPVLPAGIYPVTLKVTGTSGEVASVTQDVEIVNHPPTADAGGPYTLNFNGTVALTGSGADALDPCNTAFTYAWDIDGDGTFEYSPNRTIRYSVIQPLLGSGDYPITFKVTDSGGAFATADTTLSVGPAPNADAPATITVPAYSSTGSYTISWAPATIVGATYTLEEATDSNFTNATVVASGLTTTSKAITGKTGGLYFYRVQTIAVATVPSTWTAGNNPCAILITAITDPVNGANFNPGQLTAIVGTATTPTGYVVASMAFYENGVLIGTDSDGAPYTVAYNPTSGAHLLTATTTYVGGAVSPSSDVAIAIAGVDAPVLTTSSAIYDLGGTITLNVTPAAVVGVFPVPTVVAVAYYENGTPIGFDDTAPYSLAWVPATGGAKGVTAVALYSNGMSATSAVLSLSLNTQVAAPGLISVPTTSPTGTYTVSWGASATSEVTYVLEESTTNTFDVVTSHLPSNWATTSFDIMGKSGGTYYYRVSAVKAPMVASNWTVDGNGIFVGAQAPALLSVPAIPTNGKATVLAATSPTPGAIYLFEYSTDGSTWTVASNSTNREPIITLPAPNNYQFRVSVTATGYQQSKYTAGSNNCNWVVVQATAPVTLSVPVAPTNSKVAVLAATSPTPGAIYLFEYSTNGATWSIGSNSTNRGPTITLPAPGNYQFRVSVTATNFTQSDYTSGTNNCNWVVVPATAPSTLSVPLTSTNGKVTVLAATSPTPGAIYLVEYSTNGSTWSIGSNSTNRGPTITLPAPGNYQFRVSVTASNFTKSSYTLGSNNCSWVAPPATAPSSLSVPAISTNGTVALLASISATPSAIYLFEYSVDGSTWSTGYSGTNINPTITLPASGNYQFRVSVTSAAFSQSTFTMGGNNCYWSGVVQAAAPTSLSVPVAPTDGKVTVLAATSPTPGAIYLVEYSTDGLTWSSIGSNNSGRQPTITLPAPGNYQFRVSVTAAGYAQSTYTAGNNNCNWVIVPATAPATLSVPLTTTIGKVTVLAATSPTPGAIYLVEYSTDGLTWSSIGSNNSGREPTITLPAPGNYQFRVSVTATNFTQSGFTTGSNNCSW